jgi:hypothetical protein
VPSIVCSDGKRLAGTSSLIRTNAFLCSAVLQPDKLWQSLNGAEERRSYNLFFRLCVVGFSVRIGIRVTGSFVFLRPIRKVTENSWIMPRVSPPKFFQSNKEICHPTLYNMSSDPAQYVIRPCTICHQTLYNMSSDSVQYVIRPCTICHPTLYHISYDPVQYVIRHCTICHPTLYNPRYYYRR